MKLPDEESLRIRALKVKIQQQATEIYLLKELLNMKMTTTTATSIIAWRIARLFGVPRHFDQFTYIVNGEPMKETEMVKEVIKTFKD